MSVGILRVPGGLDHSAIVDPLVNQTANGSEETEAEKPTTEKNNVEASSGLHLTESTAAFLDKVKTLTSKPKKKPSLLVSLPKDVVENITQFKQTQRSGYIDVWWLYDDGGLTVLLPHIINRRTQYRNCKIRVFCRAKAKENAHHERNK